MPRSSLNSTSPILGFRAVPATGPHGLSATRKHGWPLSFVFFAGANLPSDAHGGGSLRQSASVDRHRQWDRHRWRSPEQPPLKSARSRISMPGRLTSSRPTGIWPTLRRSQPDAKLPASGISGEVQTRPNDETDELESSAPLLARPGECSPPRSCARGTRTASPHADRASAAWRSSRGASRWPGRRSWPSSRCVRGRPA